MATRYPSDWLEELRQRADIIQVVGSYTNLKRMGSRYVGLCPFHNETAPSFSVDAHKQLYHCFGCKAGGTVFNFIMDIEHMNFGEAVAFLADRVGMHLPQIEYDPEYKEKKSKKERIYVANKAAAIIYHDMLWSQEGQAVLDYFKSRGISDSSIRRFGLGAATNISIIFDRLSKQGFSQTELLEAGLITNKYNKNTDVFRSRAMFPIIDTLGNVLGFGARALGDAMPKYLNTAETLAFNKRKMVYSVNLLKKEKNLKRVILVEGYMDVISLVQAGINGVIATLGTALTPEQARLMSRFAPEVLVCYDGDEAGQVASEKAIKIFDEQNVLCKLLTIPYNMDPDDYVIKYGKQAFESLNTMNKIEFTLNRAKAKLDLSKEDDRLNYAKICSNVLAQINDPVEIENHIKHIIIDTGFSREVLLAQIAVDKPEIHRFLIKDEVNKNRKSNIINPQTQAAHSEKLLLAVLATGRIPKDSIDENIFFSKILKQAYLELLQGQSVAQIIDQTEENEDRTLLSDIFAIDLPNDEFELMQMAQDCVKKIQKQKLSDEYKQLHDSLKSLTPKEQLEVAEKAAKILMQLKSL